MKKGWFCRRKKPFHWIQITYSLSVKGDCIVFTVLGQIAYKYLNNLCAIQMRLKQTDTDNMQKVGYEYMTCWIARSLGPLGF